MIRVEHIDTWGFEHALDEWREFCEILRGLPYIKEIRGEKK